MEDPLTICRHCSWIHVDGAGDYCNGCGARHGAAVPQTRVMPRPSFGVDIASASLLLVLFALLVVAAR
jgi:hypothetical protein